MGGGKGGCSIVHLASALPQQQHPQRAFSAAAGGGKTNPIKAKITGSLLDARVRVVGHDKLGGKGCYSSSPLP
jgi:hypothetical protein